MSRSLDVDATDTYQVLLCPGTTRVTLQITGGKVAVGFGHGSPPLFPNDDEPYLPVVAGLARSCDAVRFKRSSSQPTHVILIAG